MAPPEDQTTQRNPPHDDDNPFVAIRRYADEAMASMLQSFIGLPSTFNFPNPQDRWLNYDEEARRRTMESWGAAVRDEGNNGIGNSASTRADGNSEKIWEIVRPSYHGLEPQRKPYIPREFPPFSGNFHPWDPFDLEFFSHENTHQPMREWISRYLAGSPYSPTNLETMRDMGRSGVAWRRAFEDLLDAQYGKEIKSREAYPRAQDGESPMQWAWRILKRPELAEPAERAGDDSKTASKSPQSQDAREHTELDMYEQFLGKDLGANKAQSGSSGGDEPSPAKDTRSDGIVATLTTTERIVLPDGTTNTKVVLKKRFADGREETSESVHTKHGAQDSSKSVANDAKSSNQKTGELSEKDNEKDKKGWFWT